MSLTSVLLLILALLAAALLALVLRTRALAAQAERQVPQLGEIVPVPGGAIHVVEMGPEDAPPLVLIHGLSGQLQHFTYALAGLLAGEFRVIALDRPGCGYSRRALVRGSPCPGAQDTHPAAPERQAPCGPAPSCRFRA